MKTSLTLLAFFFVTLFSTAFAASVVIERTTGWQGVPITVDTSGNTYTLGSDVVTPSGNYYYSYSGYRCFRERQTFAGIDALTFNASVSGGPAIYCYRE